MYNTINVVVPAEGKKERVQEMLNHLVTEVEKHEPDALAFHASWDPSTGVFYVLESFTDEAAHEHHRNQPYTAELRRISQEEHNLAKKVEVRVVEKFAGFNR